VLCLGYEGERIREAISSLQPPDGGHVAESPEAGRWHVTFADTGIETPTGGRVARVAHLLEGGTFCVTYSDGVADVDLAALLRHHRSQRRAATVTVVRPRSPWGVAELDGGSRVLDFREKPLVESWVNGGFFVMEPRALRYIGPGDSLERRPLRSLARDGELTAYRHEGFWECMDTYKDSLHLNDLWEQGEAPWAARAGERVR
jgi:glucose-1-phosphate cytidylyltransferase